MPKDRQKKITETTNPPEKSFLEVLERRAGKALAGHIIARTLQKINPFSPLDKAYSNTQKCASFVIKTNENKFTSKYCKNRFCPLCSSILAAKLVETFVPEIDQFNECVLLTLTMKTVDKQGLKARIDLMNKVWARIRMRKEVRRRIKDRVKGIIKLEVTIRPGGMFHPHFHLLLNDRSTAELISRLWVEEADKLGLWGNKPYLIEGQDIVTMTANNVATSKRVLEVFKYVTKLAIAFSKEGEKIDYKSLDHIYACLSGRRIFRSFGKWQKERKDELSDSDIEAVEADKEIEELCYIFTSGGYTGVETGERIEAKVEAKMQMLLKKEIKAERAKETTDKEIHALISEAYHFRNKLEKDLKREAYKKLLGESEVERIESENKLYRKGLRVLGGIEPLESVTPLEMQEIMPNYGFLTENLPKVYKQGQIFIDTA